MLKSVRGIPSKIRRKRTKSERRNRTKESVVIEEVEAKPHREKLDLLYSIQEDPPWYTCLILGFQHYLTMFGATMAYPLILAIPLCIEDNALVKSDLISTIFFMAGLSTLLQTTFGCRLPIVQGGTYAFLVPAIAILNLEKYKCPEMKVPVNNTDLSTSPPETEITMTASSFMATDTSDVTNLMVSMAVNSNLTQPELIPITLALKGEEVMNWKVRMREIQGAIIVSSLFQVVIGFTGIIGFMLRYIGPLSIAPTIALVGLSLFSTAGRLAGEHWWISCLTFGLLILFSQYLKDVKTPVPAYTRKKGCHVSWWPSFKLFPVLLAIVIAWVLCVILTATDVFPNNKSNWQYGARTDRYREVGQTRNSNRPRYKQSHVRKRAQTYVYFHTRSVHMWVCLYRHHVIIWAF
ncbi:solute carrier family 23 member 2-like [Ptychodera flava]|uniref:solute carrier family 23 member 2-like n=1 Tax=Ptychodera flava TaxID=63121 RepID=UPI00396A20C2